MDDLWYRVILELKFCYRRFKTWSFWVYDSRYLRWAMDTYTTRTDKSFDVLYAWGETSNNWRNWRLIRRRIIFHFYNPEVLYVYLMLSQQEKKIILWNLQHGKRVSCFPRRRKLFLEIVKNIFFVLSYSQSIYFHIVFDVDCHECTVSRRKKYFNCKKPYKSDVHQK